MADIEAYLTEHRSLWINDLTCCQSEDYKNQTTFQFLPGHKTIVLNIPEQIKQMSVVEQLSIVEPVVHVTKAKSDSTDGVLIAKLISNLMAYMKKNEFTLPEGILSSKNIRNFERGSDIDDFVCKCRFVCSFCPKNFPVKFKKFWMSSNVTKHLREHIEIEYVAEQQEKTENEHVHAIDTEIEQNETNV